MGFQLIAGHPALDFINTLDWRFGGRDPMELLNTYDDLLRFTEESKLLTAAQTRHLQPYSKDSSGALALSKAIQLREAMADIFYALIDGRNPPAESRGTLERNFHAARLRQTLDWTESPQLRWAWPTGENEPDLPVWVLAASAADLMTSAAVHRVRACDDSQCRWLFLDTTKNHTRRWCEMRLCGNRMKARRFKAHKRN